MYLSYISVFCFFFFFQAEDGIRDLTVTGVQTCALPIFSRYSDAIGRALLPLVERRLHLREQVLGAQHLGMRERHDAGGEARNLARAQVGERVPQQQLAQPLDELAPALGVGLRQDEREFVAAVAGDEVGRADLALHHGAELAQHPVARLLAEPLVDVAQPVHVDHDEREAQRIAAGPPALLAPPAIQPPATGSPRRPRALTPASLAAGDRRAPPLLLQHPPRRLGDR